MPLMSPGVDAPLFAMARSGSLGAGMATLSALPPPPGSYTHLPPGSRHAMPPPPGSNAPLFAMARAAREGGMRRSFGELPPPPHVFGPAGPRLWPDARAPSSAGLDLDAAPPPPQAAFFPSAGATVALPTAVPGEFWQGPQSLQPQSFQSPPARSQSRASLPRSHGPYPGSSPSGPGPR